MRRLLGQTEKLSSRSSKISDAQAAAEFIELGRVVNTHGVRGEVRFLPYAPPCPTLRSGLTVTLRKKDQAGQTFEIAQIRPHASFLLLQFKGIDSRDHAETLRDSVLLVAKEILLPLQEGEFYYYQVIGLPVRTTADEIVGTITQVFSTGGHDVWVVHNGKKEYLIPVVEDIVQTIDIENRRVIIDPPEGLLE